MLFLFHCELLRDQLYQTYFQDRPSPLLHNLKRKMPLAKCIDEDFLWNVWKLCLCVWWNTLKRVQELIH